MSRGIARSALAGALGALPVALVDLGMSWSFLAKPADRAEMLARLVGLLVPIGALLAVAITALVRALSPWIQRRRLTRARWPLPFVAILSPLLVAIAWLSFRGGMASRLPYRPLLVIGAALALALVAYVAVRVARQALERTTRARTYARVSALVALFAAFSAADHLILPGLYDHLHAVLAVASWACATLACAVVLPVGAFDRAPRADRVAAIAVAVLLGVGVVDVATLDHNQTVHLGVLSPRASAARSIMLAVGPLRPRRPTTRAASVERARRARVHRELGATADGPRFAGAHLLLVTIDALRADHLGAYGFAERPTSPAIDRFAEGAVVFEAAYAQAPHSSYSIGSLMASSYLFARARQGLGFPTETIAGRLAGAGYHTAAFYTEGIFHTDGERLAAFQTSGFDFARREHDELGAELKTDAVLSEVDAIVAAGEPPSFLWVHYFDVHEPYRQTTFGDSDVERYDSEIRVVDAAFDRLVREIDARTTRPVIVAVTADHGEEFRDHGGVYHGHSVYQEQVRVPLIVRVPSGLRRRVEAPVELVDVAPTLLGLLEVRAPESMEGDDLRPLLEGRAPDLGPAFASASTRHMAVTWPHKLVLDVLHGTVELYDLEADPRERQNLADEAPAIVDALSGEVRAWLDALAEDDDPHLAAIRRGRSRDRGAAPGLVALLEDRGAAAALRAEAALLLGVLEVDARAPLAAALRDPSPDVAAEAAIALGRAGDRRALRPLRALAEDDDREAGEDEAERAARVAIARGRLGDRGAVPGLIAALDEAIPRVDRYAALHALGTLGDARAVEPLIELLEDARLRRPAAIALGRIGDARAREPLVELLETSTQSSVRDGVARALGELGDATAVPELLALAAEGRPSASESLVRLGAIGASVGGADVGPRLARRTRGLLECEAAPEDDEWVFLGRTRCRTRADAVTLPIEVPPALRARAELRVRLRRVDRGGAANVRVLADGRSVGTIAVDGEWSEPSLPVEAIRRDVRLEGATDTIRLEIDHVLVLPRTRETGEPSTMTERSTARPRPPS